MPLEVAPRTPIEYEAVRALLGMMRELEASTGSPDAAFEVSVNRRSVRRGYRRHLGESTAMPMTEWAAATASMR